MNYYKNRCVEIITFDGTVALIKAALFHVYSYLENKLKKNPYFPFIDKQPYQLRRIDNEFRWSFISPYLEHKDTCIDIGCAQGYFTKQAAAEGLFALGIDQDKKKFWKP